jgi:hypothetical protein
VLRDVLREIVQEEVDQGRMSKDELQFLQDGIMIPHECLRVLTDKMGAKLVVHNQIERLLAYEPQTRIFESPASANWQVELFFHVTPEGHNHFNFNYPRLEQNVAHNAIRAQDQSILLRGLGQIAQGTRVSDQVRDDIFKKIMQSVNARLNPAQVLVVDPMPSADRRSFVRV